jgi:pimeloyl-ACP methyl ester carboxylesterase
MAQTGQSNLSTAEELATLVASTFFTWSIIHSRHWKMQIPYLARHCRVLTFDGRGNGRSDRPVGPEAYRPAEFTADALSVMDATGTELAVLVAMSLGAPGRWSSARFIPSG